MQLFTVLLLAATANAATLPAAPFAILDPNHLFGRASNPCNSDNCVRAVQGTAKGTAQVALAKADCGKFFEKTSIVPSSTATVIQTATVTKAPAWANVEPRDEPAKTVPAYASACSGAVRYSAACSCWGITATTTTITSGVATVTNTATVTTTASCNTAEPAGSTPTALGNALRVAGPAPASGPNYPISFGFLANTLGSPAYSQYQTSASELIPGTLALYNIPNHKYGYLYHVPSGLCATVSPTSSASPLFHLAAVTLQICETCGVAPPPSQQFYLWGQSTDKRHSCVTFQGENIESDNDYYYSITWAAEDFDRKPTVVQSHGGSCIYLSEVDEQTSSHEHSSSH